MQSQNVNIVPLEERVCDSDRSAAIMIHNALVQVDCNLAGAINSFDYEAAEVLILAMLGHINALRHLTHKKDVVRAYDKGDEGGYRRAVRHCAEDLPTIKEYLQQKWQHEQVNP